MHVCFTVPSDTNVKELNLTSGVFFSPSGTTKISGKQTDTGAPDNKHKKKKIYSKADGLGLPNSIPASRIRVPLLES